MIEKTFHIISSSVKRKHFTFFIYLSASDIMIAIVLGLGEVYIFCYFIFFSIVFMILGIQYDGSFKVQH